MWYLSFTAWLILLFVTAWMELESIMLSEISQVVWCELIFIYFIFHICTIGIYRIYFIQWL